MRDLPCDTKPCVQDFMQQLQHCTAKITFDMLLYWCQVHWQAALASGSTRSTQCQSVSACHASNPDSRFMSRRRCATVGAKFATKYTPSVHTFIFCTEAVLPGVPAAVLSAAAAAVCFETPTVGNGTFDCSSHNADGDTCTGTCNTNYAGQPTVTCRSDGTWSEVTGSCEGGVD